MNKELENVTQKDEVEETEQAVTATAKVVDNHPWIISMIFMGIMGFLGMIWELFHDAIINNRTVTVKMGENTIKAEAPEDTENKFES